MVDRDNKKFSTFPKTKHFPNFFNLTWNLDKYPLFKNLEVMNLPMVAAAKRTIGMCNIAKNLKDAGFPLHTKRVFYWSRNFASVSPIFFSPLVPRKIPPFFPIPKSALLCGKNTNYKIDVFLPGQNVLDRVTPSNFR